MSTDPNSAAHRSASCVPAVGSLTSACAAMAVPRLYHSAALLLPDGRVLAAGGGHPRDSAHGDPDQLEGGTGAVSQLVSVAQQ